MKLEINHKYDSIINLEHYKSKKHPPMSLYARSAQFAPFAALTGYEEAVLETSREVNCSQLLNIYLISVTLEVLKFFPNSINDNEWQLANILLISITDEVSKLLKFIDLNEMHR